MKFKMWSNENGDDLMENGVTKMSEKVKVPVWFDQWLSDHGNTDRIELIKAIINNAHEKISLIVNDKAHPVADQDKLKFISAILNGQSAAITGEQIVSGTVSADKIALNINTKAPDIDIVSYGLFYKNKVFTHEQKLFEKYLERVFIDHNKNIIQTIIYCNSNPRKMHHEEWLAYKSLTIREINQVVNKITK